MNIMANSKKSWSLFSDIDVNSIVSRKKQKTGEYWFIQCTLNHFEFSWGHQSQVTEGFIYDLYTPFMTKYTPEQFTPRHVKYCDLYWWHLPLLRWGGTAMVNSFILCNSGKTYTQNSILDYSKKKSWCFECKMGWLLYVCHHNLQHQHQHPVSYSRTNVLRMEQLQIQMFWKRNNWKKHVLKIEIRALINLSMDN